MIWRLQCNHCEAVFSILPHFVLRYQSMNPARAAQVLLATHGGLSLEWTATVFEEVSAMAIYRLLRAFGQACLVTVLTRCSLPLPRYLIADEKHSGCLTEKVYLPTIVVGRLIWHLGYVEDKSADAFQASYRKFQQAAQRIEATYTPKGILTDGFESTRKSLRTLFPNSPLGSCLLHATQCVRQKLKSVASSGRKRLSQEFHDLFQDRSQSKLLKVFSLGQKLRRFAERVTKRAGTENGERVREWVSRKKEGWFVLFRDPDIPATSTFLDQAHNVIDRKLFMMKGFHHPEGSQKAFLTGLALLYNFIPYQRRAKHAGKCGVEVEGGTLPTNNWFLNLQILTSGGFQ